MWKRLYFLRIWSKGNLLIRELKILNHWHITKRKQDKKFNGVRICSNLMSLTPKSVSSVEKTNPYELLHLSCKIALKIFTLYSEFWRAVLSFVVMGSESVCPIPNSENSGTWSPWSIYWPVAENLGWIIESQVYSAADLRPGSTQQQGITGTALWKSPSTGEIRIARSQLSFFGFSDTLQLSTESLNSIQCNDREAEGAEN